MFNGPLSERIDWITEKLLGESWSKPKEKKVKFSISTPNSDEKIIDAADLWDATQVSCPIPPRNPDGWVH